jgi:hypothetical protein
MPDRPRGELPEGVSPADYPLGSVESRVAARARLEALTPLTYVVYLDDDGNPIYDPSKRYARFTVHVPRELTVEEWKRRNTPPTDPAEHEAWVKTNEERLVRQRENWLKWYRLNQERLVAEGLA